MTFNEWLKDNDACEPGMQFAAGFGTAYDAWLSCRNMHHLNWLISSFTMYWTDADSQRLHWLVRQFISMIPPSLRSALTDAARSAVEQTEICMLVDRHGAAIRGASEIHYELIALWDPTDGWDADQHMICAAMYAATTALTRDGYLESDDRRLFAESLLGYELTWLPDFILHRINLAWFAKRLGSSHDLHAIYCPIIRIAFPWERLAEFLAMEGVDNIGGPVSGPTAADLTAGEVKP
ncbi:MAG TPA: hypothetical protein VHI13_12285 [Candidatus Kapabacteria bacterium]|nr:hypothetical protein [Candidatus Kapabacteria bacterium]